MFTIYWIIVGSAGMAIGSLVLGVWLRKKPSKENAEKSSRVMHFLFFAGQVIPPVVGLFYPGFARFDEMLGLQPLPVRPLFLAFGIIVAIPGFYFLGVTNKLLRAFGILFACAGHGLPYRLDLCHTLCCAWIDPIPYAFSEIFRRKGVGTPFWRVLFGI